MKKSFKMGLIASLLSMSFCMNVKAQEEFIKSPLYGTPDKFQRYFVFDQTGFPDVESWVVKIYHDFKTDDGTILREITETVTIEDKSFFKLEDYHYGEEFGTYVEVDGIGVDGIVTEDDWIRSVPQGDPTTWKELCKGICNASTYAYSVKILEEVDYFDEEPTGNGNQIVEFTDPKYLSDPETGLVIPLYRYMVESEWSSMKSNSQIHQTNWTLDNTLAHYSLPHWHTAPDGVFLIYHPNASTGEFRNRQNQKINSGEVWGINKALGVYKNDRQGVISNTSPESSCGELLSNAGNPHTTQINEANSFTWYANQKLTFTNVTEELVCSYPWSIPGTSTSTGSGPDYTVDDFVSVHDAWTKWPWIDLPGTGGLFGGMEGTFESVRTIELFENTTGVPWWPGDAFDYIQLYRVDKSSTSEQFNKPITIYRDSLYDENENLNSFDIYTEAGLYNLSLTISSSTINIPLIVEIPVDITHQSTESLCDQLDISIYPVPIINGEFTTQASLGQQANFKYFVIDEYSEVHFDTEINFNREQTHEIHVTAPNLPNGLIFHKFEIPGVCERTITTIKNE